MIRRNLHKKVIILWLLFFIFSKSISAEPVVTQEKLDTIEKSCVDVYPIEMLKKFATNLVYNTEKGDFEPTHLEKVVETFDIFLKPGMKFIDLGSGDGRVVFFSFII